NADGTEERELTSRGGPERLWDYPCGPAWSPDGQVIFCASYHLEGDKTITTFIGVSASEGSERTIPAGKWAQVTGFAWLADGSGLMMSGVKEMRPPGTSQIWHISYQMGEVQRVTNDLDEYNGLSITTDSRVMAATQEYWTENMWVSPG